LKGGDSIAAVAKVMKEEESFEDQSLEGDDNATDGTNIE